ncbi:MAG: hypothetical protein WCP15_00550 [bacterium]
MIYLIHGTDIDASHKKVNELVDSLLKKKPDASFFKLDDESFSEGMLEEYSGGQGLFEKKYIVLLENLIGSEEWSEILLKKLDDLSKSENIFILREGKLNKKELEKVEKKAVKSQEFSLPSNGAGEIEQKEFNIFPLTDALAGKRVGDLWVGYRNALSAGVPAEQIEGVLFWQIKSMLLALKCKSAEASGLKPFVFSKSFKFAKEWGETALLENLEKLMKIYHESRRDAGGLENLLERYILELKS